MTNAEFFASGHPVLKRVIAWGAVAFSVRLALMAIVLLLAGARIAGVHSFPLDGDDRGFWFEANWSLMYAIVFPGIFGGLIYMINLMREALARLTAPDLHVITKKRSDTPDFEEYISAEMARHGRGFTWFCIALALTLTAVHAGSLAAFLIRRRNPPPILDWTVMFTTGRVTYGSNLAFDVLAYAFEALVIFLGFFFVLKFWTFLTVFSRALRDRDNPYTFDPLLWDRDTRLGLGPLGAFMNLYLLLVIIFELFVLGRRLQLVGKGGVYSLSEYMTMLVDGATKFGNAVNENLYQWPTIDAGLWASLIFLTLPLIVGAYLPLWTLRRYVRKRRDAMSDATARAYEDAKQRGDEAAAGELRREMEQLERTQLWPNGDAVGWRLLTGSVAIGVAAWAPPLCAGLIGVAFALEIGKRIIPKFTSS